MRPFRLWAACLAAALVSVPAAPAHAQPTLRLGYGAADVSMEGWGVMNGPTAGVTVEQLVGPMNVSLDFQRGSASPGTVDAWCNFVACVPGPFDDELKAFSVRAGLGGTLSQIGPVGVALSLDAVFLHQSRELTHVDTGERNTDASLTDLGLGATVSLGFPALVAGVRPGVTASFARMFEGLCGADTACYPDRNLASVGLVLAWSPRGEGNAP